MKTYNNNNETRKELVIAAALGVGSIVRYKEIIDKGDEISRFVITEDYGDGRVKVREITSLTAFGFSTYTRNLSDFVAVTDSAEIDSICEIITANDTPLYIQVMEKRNAEAAANEDKKAATIAKAAEWMSNGATVEKQTRGRVAWYLITWSTEESVTLSATDYAAALSIMAAPIVPAQSYKVEFCDAQGETLEVKTYHNTTAKDLWPILFNHLDVMEGACLSTLWIDGEDGRKYHHNFAAWVELTNGGQLPAA